MILRPLKLHLDPIVVEDDPSSPPLILHQIGFEMKSHLKWSGLQHGVSLLQKLLHGSLDPRPLHLLSALSSLTKYPPPQPSAPLASGAKTLLSLLAVGMQETYVLGSRNSSIFFVRPFGHETIDKPFPFCSLDQKSKTCTSLLSLLLHFEEASHPPPIF